MNQHKTLKITILSDNVAGRFCRAEHGLSYHIEADHTLLFDTGSSDLIRYNAEFLKINLDRIETIVLSHGHDDHSGGLMSVTGKKLICHPDTFIQRFRKSNHSELGIKWTETEIRKYFEVTTSRDPIRISDQIYFLGEIPRKTNFESQTTAFQKTDGTDDFVMDDSSLAIATSKGLVIVTGCAHSGICNTIEHARQVTGIQKVHLAIGGFHLQNDEIQTQKTIEWFLENEIDKVIPSHCTSFAAQAELFKHFPFIPAKTGNCIQVG